MVQTTSKKDIKCLFFLQKEYRAIKGRKAHKELARKGRKGIRDLLVAQVGVERRARRAIKGRKAGQGYLVGLVRRVIKALREVLAAQEGRGRKVAQGRQERQVLLDPKDHRESLVALVEQAHKGQPGIAHLTAIVNVTVTVIALMVKEAI